MKLFFAGIIIFLLCPNCTLIDRSGTIERQLEIKSKYIGSRRIDVWLPDSYSQEKSYAVLYMQDGEMVFDSEHAWNHQSWNAHLAAGKLMNEGKIRDLIIVAIHNGGYSRHAEYLPQKPCQAMTHAEQENLLKAVRSDGTSVFNGFQIQSDNYLKFLVEELKPFIDSSYSTFKDPSNTYIAGSSMGGLISCYAVCEYPNVFGGSACVSTHWPGIFSLDNNPFPSKMFEYLRTHLPDPKSHKFYFDHGTITLDSMYPLLQNEVNEIMTTGGYTHDNFDSRVFEGAAHSESSWRERFEVPLEFLARK